MQRFGIDISKYQSNMDLNRAKSEGAEFAIIRGMYGNSKDGSFENNYNKAKDAGIGVGVYWWTRAVNEAQAKEEAEILINTCLKGKQFEYPIYIDVEDSLLANLGKAKVDAIITSALTTLENAGYYAGFYLNYDWYNNKCNGVNLAKRFTLWLARWTKVTQNVPMWQFGGETNYIRTNQVAGMTCDQDYCFQDFPTIIKNAGLNGYKKEDSLQPSQPSKKSNEEIANEVIVGQWGNGEDRKNRLTSAGYDYNAIQSIVNNKVGVTKSQVNSSVYYVVQKGENLTKIAKKYGTTVNQLVAWNNIANPNLIYAGQKLRVK